MPLKYHPDIRCATIPTTGSATEEAQHSAGGTDLWEKHISATVLALQ